MIRWATSSELYIGLLFHWTDIVAKLPDDQKATPFWCKDCLMMNRIGLDNCFAPDTEGHLENIQQEELSSRVREHWLESGKRLKFCSERTMPLVNRKGYFVGKYAWNVETVSCTQPILPMIPNAFFRCILQFRSCSG